MLKKIDSIESLNFKKSQKEKNIPHAVVIGAGFGGLAAAMRLGAVGFKVTVLEQLESVGGRGSSINRNGFRFDLGPTIVTKPQLFEELWSFCGKKFEDDVKLLPCDPFYQVIFNDGSNLKTFKDEKLMIEQIKKISPSDIQGYQRLMKDSKERYEFAFSSPNKIGRVPMNNIFHTLKVIPKFISLRADRSVYSNVAKYIKDERLRMALSFHPLFVGGNPFKVTSMWGLVSYLEKKYGVHYPIGGMIAIANSMEKIILKQGNKVFLKKKVNKILYNQKKVFGVELDDGTKINSDIVVSNSDSGFTYNNLLKGKIKKRWTIKKIKKQKWSMGLCVWYFGTKDTRHLWKNIGLHTVLNGPRYKGLVKDIFLKGKLSEDMSLYVYRPSFCDNTVAPENCDTFYALSPVPNLNFDNVVNWKKEIKKYKSKMASFIDKKLLPGFEEKIVESHFMSPNDFERRYSSPFGSGFSLEPRMFQSAWFRPHNISEEIEGLFLVGAGTHPGPGVPGVIASAEILTKLVNSYINQNDKNFNLK